MSKNLLVETTGKFSLLDVNTRVEFSDTRPTVAMISQFVQHQVALGQLEILGEVHKDATDDDFIVTVRECTDEETGKADMELAVESFLAEFATEDKAVTKKTPAKGKSGGKTSTRKTTKKTPDAPTGDAPDKTDDDKPDEKAGDAPDKTDDDKPEADGKDGDEGDKSNPTAPDAEPKAS